MKEEMENKAGGKGAYGTVHATDYAEQNASTIDTRALQSLVDRGKAKSLEDAAKLVEGRMAEMKAETDARTKAQAKSQKDRAEAAKAEAKEARGRVKAEAKKAEVAAKKAAKRADKAEDETEPKE